MCEKKWQDGARAEIETLNQHSARCAVDMAMAQGTIDRLRAALERIANSEPRPKRNRDYSAFDIQALQRIARVALTG